MKQNATAFLGALVVTLGIGLYWFALIAGVWWQW